MWKCKTINNYYELTTDNTTLYLCKKKDSLIRVVLEILCDKHNEDYEKSYQRGYKYGYNRALSDIASCKII